MPGAFWEQKPKDVVVGGGEGNMSTSGLGGRRKEKDPPVGRPGSSGLRGPRF